MAEQGAYAYAGCLGDLLSGSCRALRDQDLLGGVEDAGTVAAGVGSLRGHEAIP
jgi:hypothetical protein